MKKRIFYLILFSVIILFLYIIHFPLRCPFYEITKLYCPGCGITRCIISLFHFEFYQAFRYNPLIFILLPVLIPYMIYLLIVYVFDLEDYIVKKIPSYVWVILLIITILFGILRNLSVFVFLAPTIVG